MFKNKHRINAAFAKGLLFGKAVGTRDERDRIISLLDGKICFGFKAKEDCDHQACYTNHYLIVDLRKDK